jgi:xanthine dehydrogenase accessory factor
MPHDDVYEAMSESFRSGAPVALATVAQTLGSTPRKTGAKMLVREDGTFVGTIGGGCGEAEVWQEAMDALDDGDARMVTVDLTEPVDGEDKICGGIMRIFVERLEA